MLLAQRLLKCSVHAITKEQSRYPVVKPAMAKKDLSVNQRSSLPLQSLPAKIRETFQL